MSAGDGDGGINGPTRELQFRVGLRYQNKALQEACKKEIFWLFGVDELVWLYI